MAVGKPSRPSPQIRQSLSGKRALVVAAERPERLSLIEALDGWGLTIEAAPTALDGVCMLWTAAKAGRPFDLAVYCPQDQRVSAEHFAAIVRSESRLAEIPVFHLAEGAGALRKAALRRMGYFDALAAPIDKTTLFDALHRACGHLVEAAGVTGLMDRRTALGPRTPRLDILLAASDPEQRRSVHSTLAHSGHQVFEVESGDQAIEALTKHSFDLLILALDGPGLTTTNALKLFRFGVTQDGSPACIGLAREPSPARIRDYASAGITTIVPSPVEPGTLLRAVADVIRGNGEGPIRAAGTPVEAAWLPAEVPVLDEQTLRDVEQLSPDPNFLFEVIQRFLAETGALLDGIREVQAIEQGDRRLRELGQALQDNAGSLGALRLYQLGLVASEYPTSGSDRDAGDLLSRIESAYRNTRNAFWAYLRRQGQTRSPG